MKKHKNILLRTLAALALIASLLSPNCADAMRGGSATIQPDCAPLVVERDYDANYQTSIFFSGPNQKLGPVLEREIRVFKVPYFQQRVTHTFIDVDKCTAPVIPGLLDTQGDADSTLQINVSRQDGNSWKGLPRCIDRTRLSQDRFVADAQTSPHNSPLWSARVVNTHKKRIIMHTDPVGDHAPQEWLIINGSANLSYNGLTQNYELSFIVHVDNFDDAPEHIKQYCLRNLADHYAGHLPHAAGNHRLNWPAWLQRELPDGGVRLRGMNNAGMPLKTAFANSQDIGAQDHNNLRAYLVDLIQQGGNGRDRPQYTEFYLTAMTFGDVNVQQALEAAAGHGATVHVLGDGSPGTTPQEQAEKAVSQTSLNALRNGTPGIEQTYKFGAAGGASLWHGKMLIARGDGVDPVCVIMSANCTANCLQDGNLANVATIITDNQELYTRMREMFENAIAQQHCQQVESQKPAAGGSLADRLRGNGARAADAGDGGNGWRNVHMAHQASTAAAPPTVHTGARTGFGCGGGWGGQPVRAAPAQPRGLYSAPGLGGNQPAAGSLFDRMKKN